MARSILPCKHRKQARQAKARASRRHRRRGRQALHVGDWDDAETGARTVDRERRREMGDVVWYRRGADKVNHFCRWANARTRDAKNDVERYFQAKSLLGGESLINDHALFHFVDLEWAENPTLHSSTLRPRRAKPRRPFRSEKHLRKLLRRAFEVAHGELNRTLKPLRLPGCLRSAPCRHVRPASACDARLVVRVPDDLLCIAHRLWAFGERALPELECRVEERVAEFLREQDLLD